MSFAVVLRPASCRRSARFRRRAAPRPSTAPAGPSMPCGIGDAAAEHLVAAAQAEHAAAAADMGDDVDVPALLPQDGEIGDGRLRARQEDEIGLAGSGRPGGTMSTATSGSARSGSRSSKLAMRGSSGTAIRIAAAPLASYAGQARRHPLPAGAAQPSNQGTTPRLGRPVRSRMIARPSSNSRRSPRNLLTMIALQQGALLRLAAARGCRPGWR